MICNKKGLENKISQFEVAADKIGVKINENKIKDMKRTDTEFQKEVVQVETG